ncbi:MAG: RNA polymerase sigma factor [Chloroflexi bacterium]|nr:RNA polymerase sigma factor [Chloroflexota bacterium]
MQVTTLTGLAGTQRVAALGGESFEQAFHDYQPGLYTYLLRMIGNPDDAYDLALASFEKAYRAWSRAPSGVELKPWLYRIATNTCLDELRRRKLVRWLPWDGFVQWFHPSQVAPENPEREVVRGEQTELVRRAMDQLPERYRACLVLRECEELSCEEIADVLGMTRGAVKTTLFRARERLRKVYEAMGGEALDG